MAGCVTGEQGTDDAAPANDPRSYAAAGTLFARAPTTLHSGAPHASRESQTGVDAPQILRLVRDEILRLVRDDRTCRVPVLASHGGGARREMPQPRLTRLVSRRRRSTRLTSDVLYFVFRHYTLRIYCVFTAHCAGRLRPAWVPLSKENGLGPRFLAAARGPAPDAALCEPGRGPTRRGRTLSESASPLRAACCVLRVLGWQMMGSGSRRAELSMAYMPQRRGYAATLIKPRRHGLLRKCAATPLASSLPCKVAGHAVFLIDAALRRPGGTTRVLSPAPLAAGLHTLGPRR